MNLEIKQSIPKVQKVVVRRKSYNTKREDEIKNKRNKYSSTPFFISILSFHHLLLGFSFSDFVLKDCERVVSVISSLADSFLGKKNLFSYTNDGFHHGTAHIASQVRR